MEVEAGGEDPAGMLPLPVNARRPALWTGNFLRVVWRGIFFGMVDGGEFRRIGVGLHLGEEEELGCAVWASKASRSSLDGLLKNAKSVSSGVEAH